MLWDITQAYIELKTELNCLVIYYLQAKLKRRYLDDTILLIIRLLYSLAKAENHQFTIYLDFFKKKLDMEILPYDTYLLITKNSNKNFGITKL